MNLLTLRLPSDRSLSAPLPDERLSTWAQRNAVSIGATNPFGAVDRDYGQLEVSGDVGESLEAKLASIALAPAPYVLAPGDRSLYCPQCLLDDFSRGHPRYYRRTWTVAWHTQCSKHGPLEDYCATSGDREPRSLRELRKHLPLLPCLWVRYSTIDSHGKATLPLIRQYLCGQDRRAYHLEALLDETMGGPRTSWHPSGLTGQKLFAVYWQIVNALCMQYDWASPNAVIAEAPSDRPLQVFLRMPNDTRHAFNALAEAIISLWTGTPLPRRFALQRRTELLAHAVGWWPYTAKSDSGARALIGGGKPYRNDIRVCLDLAGQTPHTEAVNLWLKSRSSGSAIKELLLHDAQLIQAPWDMLVKR